MRIWAGDARERSRALAEPGNGLQSRRGEGEREEVLAGRRKREGGDMGVAVHDAEAMVTDIRMGGGQDQQTDSANI